MTDPSSTPLPSGDSGAQEGLFGTRFDGPSPEISVSNDIIKRGLLVGPILVAICGVIWGADGVWSSLFGLAIILANFALSAASISFAAKISVALIMGVTLFGYLIRLGLIFLAVWLVQDASWISFPALGSTIIITHLGLLFWEMKYVAMSLAYPGLKPRPAQSGRTPD